LTANSIQKGQQPKRIVKLGSIDAFSSSFNPKSTSKALLQGAGGNNPLKRFQTGVQ